MKRITRKLVLKALTSERRRPIFFEGWDQDLSGVSLRVFIYAIDGDNPQEYDVTAIPATGNPAGEFTVVYADFTLVEDLPAGEYFLKVATADITILRHVLLLFNDDAHSFRDIVSSLVSQNDLVAGLGVSLLLNDLFVSPDFTGQDALVFDYSGGLIIDDVMVQEVLFDQLVISAESATYIISDTDPEGESTESFNYSFDFAFA